MDRHSAFEAEKKKNAELGLYAQAVREGSQPWGTTAKQTTHALNESDKLGRPFRADNMGATYHPDIVKELTGKPPISATDNARLDV